MAQDVFDHSSMILAFIEAKRENHWHQDFETYHKAFFAVLQKAFQIEMSQDGIKSFDGKMFFALFGNIVQSYIRLTTPSGILEGGLLETKVEALGDAGERINQARGKLDALKRESVRTHLELLNELFQQIWQPAKQTVTRDELTQIGFTLHEPNMADYWDEM